MFVVACFNVTSAYASHLNASVEADCNGIKLSGTVCESYCTGGTHKGIFLMYTINVNGEIITGNTWQEVDLNAWACLPFSIYIPFDKQMCGDIAISGILEYTDSLEHFNGGYIRETYEIQESVLGCPCDVFCPRTPGYWKNHSKDWPVDSIVIGGKTLTKKEAISILKTPVIGDIEIILKKHLISAILNVASGSDPSISGVIEEAFECLASDLCDRAKKEELKNILDVYNNGENCNVD
jgi:hypothetical protein